MTTPSPRGPEPSNRALLARIVALEERLRDIEGPYAETAYKTARRVTRNELRMERLLAHFGVADVTDDEVEARLDEEA